MLDKASNPKYYNIADRCEQLNRKIYILNQEIIMLKVSNSFWFWGTKKKLEITEIKLNELQKEFYDWHAKAILFDQTYDIKDISKAELTFLYYNTRLEQAINQLGNSMSVLVSNANNIRECYSHKIDFSIALTGWFFTFLGLIASLIALIG